MRFFIIIIIAATAVFSWSGFKTSRAEAIFFNVGQGDSFLLHTPGGLNILVDGGPDWYTLYALGRYFSGHRPVIDLLILSHGHDDHLSALPELARRYQVKRAFLPARINGDAGSALFSSLTESGAVISYPADKLCLELETDCRLCLFPPGKEFLDSDDDNDLSSAINFNCAGLSLSAAGDASGRREQALLAEADDLRAQILKASHHGSAYANSEDFIEAVNPGALIISVGANNYGHPDAKLIHRAQLSGIKVWRTDEDGDILFYAKNSQLYVSKPW
ncbi:MAG: MBL fold metallo-hydrolase [Patescibacteria group bacterium]|nr:MBL fold metallo-hydrolase [Patescibacteria group bacterium]